MGAADWCRDRRNPRQEWRLSVPTVRARRLRPAPHATTPTSLHAPPPGPRPTVFFRSRPHTRRSVRPSVDEDTRPPVPSSGGRSRRRPRTPSRVQDRLALKILGSVPAVVEEGVRGEGLTETCEREVSGWRGMSLRMLTSFTGFVLEGRAGSRVFFFRFVSVLLFRFFCTPRGLLFCSRATTAGSWLARGLKMTLRPLRPPSTVAVSRGVRTKPDLIANATAHLRALSRLGDMSVCLLKGVLLCVFGVLMYRMSC